MADIRVSPAMLNARAGELRGLKAEHEDVINRMRAVVNGLDDVFAGQAKEAYVARFEGMQPTFASFAELLESLAAALDTAAASMSEADSATAARIGG